MTRIIDFS